MSFLNIVKNQKLVVSLASMALLLYVFFAYELERSNFPLLVTVYGILFLITYLILEKTSTNFWLIAAIAILLRLIFIPAVPNLSQDFYRFIWDGRILAQGFNPYLVTPQSYIEAGDLTIVDQASKLFAGMGTLNASNFTNYPPINQLLFAFAGLVSGKSIVGATIILRLIIILADVGIIIFGKKLLENVGLPIANIFWYALNPFVIIEMTGNLHFESVMLFFVVLSFYFLHKNQWIWAAVALAISISIKLLPLLFLPLYIQYFLSSGGSKSTHFRGSYPLQIRLREILLQLPRLLYFYALVVGIALLTFIPFLSGEFTANFGASIALWFNKFEFNASIYYIIRYIGFQTIGWNIIGDVGPLLPKIVIAFLIALAFIRTNRTLQQLITAILFGISFYFMFSTTVHPWYVATPLMLCLFTRYKYPIVWSATIICSYSAYQINGFQENLWLVGLEYCTMIGYMLWEVFWKKGRQRSYEVLQNVD